MALSPDLASALAAPAVLASPASESAGRGAAAEAPPEGFERDLDAAEAEAAAGKSPTAGPSKVTDASKDDADPLAPASPRVRNRRAADDASPEATTAALLSAPAALERPTTPTTSAAPPDVPAAPGTTLLRTSVAAVAAVVAAPTTSAGVATRPANSGPATAPAPGVVDAAAVRAARETVATAPAVAAEPGVPETPVDAAPPADAPDAAEVPIATVLAEGSPTFDRAAVAPDVAIGRTGPIRAEAPVPTATSPAPETRSTAPVARRAPAVARSVSGAAVPTGDASASPAHDAIDAAIEGPPAPTPIPVEARRAPRPSVDAAAPTDATRSNAVPRPVDAADPSPGAVSDDAAAPVAPGAAFVAVGGDAAQDGAARDDARRSGDERRSDAFAPQAPVAAASAGTRIDRPVDATPAASATLAAPPSGAARLDLDRTLAALSGEIVAGRREIRLKLDPQDLGKMTVRLTTSGDTVLARLVVERA
ncbi:MAG TPA: hypothetical protein VEI02_12695, partial [Planctomycetota bacterium]|nr:hypothetical protein [Planctomycetota bacterium]